MANRTILRFGVGLLFLLWLASPAFSQAGPAPLEIRINAGQPQGSTAPMHRLLSGVGVDFNPPPILAERLRAIGITRLRLINVEGQQSRLEDGRLKTPHLDGELKRVQLWGCQPHIIIGLSIPLWLSSHEQNPKFGPRDWPAYQDYMRQFFEHVILEKGFRNAVFEVSNEPDISGAPIPVYRAARKYGSEEDYLAYFELYRHIAAAATQFEQAHPDVKITLGGPATTGVGTYFHSKQFNWHERFLRDTARAKAKLDFFSFHYYGNQGPVGPRRSMTPFPPFEKIMADLKGWIAQYRPGLPIWLTEWGPSFVTQMTPAGIINANNVGAAWCAAFIPVMLQTQVAQAFFLAAADLQDNWGWPALFHGLTPKPPYFVFEMLHRLQGPWLQVQGDSTAVGAMAAGEGTRLAVVLWNYNWLRGERDGGQEGASQERVTLRITGLSPGKEKYQVIGSQIDAQHGNPQAGFPEPLPLNLGGRSAAAGAMDLVVALPPSSVTFLEIH